MAEFPALPLFTDAYLADTHPSLTLEEHGCYLLLLQISWRQPTCTLPDDDAFLARALALHGNRWTRLRKQILERFFQRNSEGRWYQKRLIKEWKYVHRKRKVRISDEGVILPTPEESGVENARKSLGNVSETSRKSSGNAILNEDNSTTYEPSPTPTPTPTPITLPVGFPAADATAPPAASPRPVGNAKGSSVPTAPSERGARLPPDWQPSPADAEFATALGLKPPEIAARFRDYWIAQPGQKGVKRDWPATWRNWCRKEAETRPKRKPESGYASILF